MFWENRICKVLIPIVKRPQNIDFFKSLLDFDETLNFYIDEF